MKKFFAIDLMPFLYRGHFVFLKNPRMTAEGVNTSALTGFVNSLVSILKEHKPDYVAIAADSTTPTFRHQMYPAYKAQREKMPEDIAQAIPLAIEFAAALDIPVVRKDDFEADDVLGTLSRLGAAAGLDVYIATPDKDAAQLVSPSVKLYRPGRSGDAAEIYDEAKVCEHWHLSSPRQMIDYLALAGDTSDNIPGIRGVGEKTAAGLLEKWHSVEEIAAHAAEIPGKLGEKIRAGLDDLALSRKLVEIRTDVPLDNFDMAALERREAKTEALGAFCRRYELNRAYAALAPQDAAKPPLPPAAQATVKPFLSLPHDYRLVKTQADAEALAAELAGAVKIAFDTETTGTDPRKDRLVGISFATAPGKAWYVPVPPYDTPPPQAVAGLELFAAAGREDAPGAARERVGAFKRIFAGTSKILIAHNAKFDIEVLTRYGIEFGATVRDTMLEHYVLDAAERHGKEFLARELLHVEAMPITELIGPGKAADMGELAPEAITEYAAQDADLALQWDAILRGRVSAAGSMGALADAEEPLVQVLIDMEKAGVRFDVAALSKLGVQLGAEIATLAGEIHAVAGAPFNIDSPKQLGEFLFGSLKLAGGKKTATGQFATDEKTLSKLAGEHPVVAKILEYRALQKLKGTYVDKLPRMVDPADGRIHTTFTQAFTETGRLSSVNPNLQNIPVRKERGKALRAAVVPSEPGWKIVSADYSQIELRIMAAMSGDENMIRAFKEGADIHRETAARVYDVMSALVTDDMRSKCKMVNFGIIYGISAFGLAERLGISRKEAAALIEAYFKMYPKIKAFMEALVAKARAKGYAETLLGRRRSLRDIASRNGPSRQAAERDAINTPVQGTAADLIKLAMVRVAKRLKIEGFRAKMILQIHDELLFEAPEDELERLVPAVREEMQNAMSIGVPLEVSIGTGPNWLEAH